MFSITASGSVIGRMWTTVAVRRALFVGCMLQFFQQIVGINTVMYGVPLAFLFDIFLVMLLLDSKSYISDKQKDVCELIV